MPTDIVAATAAYDAWVRQTLADHAPINAKDLALKHAEMAKRDAPHRFLRATYYRWAEVFPEVCPDLAAAPAVTSVGDLHGENFGFWRDAEGRLAWGVNDLDEADRLPYTNDLVRLATSLRLAAEHEDADLPPPRAACELLLDGYRQGLADGPRPIVLDERHPELRAVALAATADPGKFAAKLEEECRRPEARPPTTGRQALAAALPPDVRPGWDVELRQAGLGSLGRPRLVARVPDWHGGPLVREAKARVPAATRRPTTRGRRGGAADDEAGDDGPNDLAALINTSPGRSPDPHLHLGPGWVVRRLSPDCRKIDWDDVGADEDEEDLVRLMGREVANLHLAGGDRPARAVRRDLDKRPADWLRKAAKAMARATVEDHEAWRAHQRAGRHRSGQGKPDAKG